MSLDPVAAGPPPDVAAIIARELAALASDAQLLAKRLSTGDVVSAVVLASNGLTDLLDIGGLRVAAELPSTLLPGETITVAVTGFSDDRINLRIVSLPEKAGQLAPPPSAPARSAPDFAATSAVAPASAVVPTAPSPSALVGRAPGPTLSGTPPPLVAARFPQPSPPAGLQTIEARLATAHAMSPPGSRPPSPDVPRPVIAMRAARALALPEPAASTSPRSVSASPTSDSPVTPAARGLAAFAEPVALLRALKLPVTATNVASARLALDSPEKVPYALATLERALAGNADSRVSTLRTLTSFLTRLDPRSPVFPTQVEAFVDQVVTGAEAKIAALARAADAVAAPLGPERVAVARVALEYDLKTQLLGFAADRAGGGTNAAPAQTSALHAAVNGALTAITALQLNAAATLDANPGGLAFTLPIASSGGVAQAHVRIARDSSDAHGAALDGDNFHVGFVLETQHLGVVAIDLKTVGRVVTIGVTTEAALAQRALGNALGTLTERLETLHYHVAEAAAVVAPPRATSQTTDSSDRPAPPADPAQLVDIDA